MSHAVFAAAHSSLQSLVKEYLAALDGIPDDELISWKPAAERHGGGEMNTLAGLSVHTALAGTWMIVHQVFGQDFPRDRIGEFTTTATREEINELFATMLNRFADLMENDSEIDLGALPPSLRSSRPEATRGEFLIHAVDHTAQHLGHAQITRQLWLAERGAAS